MLVYIYIESHIHAYEIKKTETSTNEKTYSIFVNQKIFYKTKIFRL